jgi:hypothetical protein
MHARGMHAREVRFDFRKIVLWFWTREPGLARMSVSTAVPAISRLPQASADMDMRWAILTGPPTPRYPVGFPSPKPTFPPELLANHGPNDGIFTMNIMHCIPACLANRGYLAALARALFLAPPPRAPGESPRCLFLPGALLGPPQAHRRRAQYGEVPLYYNQALAIPLAFLLLLLIHLIHR